MCAATLLPGLNQGVKLNKIRPAIAGIRAVTEGSGELKKA